MEFLGLNVQRHYKSGISASGELTGSRNRPIIWCIQHLDIDK